ncbi:MAG: hypothetical protein ACRDV9_11520, partial [Acidimicrobiia bacterium]
DVVRVNVLGTIGLDTPSIADLRVGHMEASAKVPVGGIRCPIPVRKVASADPVLAGETFDWTITVPSAANALDGLACDLVGISAVDTAGSEDAGVKFKILSASNGGVVSADGKKVNFSGLGNYKPGSPPLTLTVQGRIEPDSTGGLVTNTVEVAANLGNCSGGASSQQLTGLAQLINNAGVTGGVKVLGPKANVLAASGEQAIVTPRTGDNSLLRSLAGLGLIGLALFGRRAIRRQG